ncbi:hypothetical protein [Leuconostoc litchii]|uniref:Uncharacterized protein n=1 Tax=Leuconostoc litchii TaxID=1981069 RepID=A0A652NE53_9LACO|nr:hypothetical protein [Leuconostoc litchii]TYC46436.1 hypothetical protein ESZ47_06180 [Leuconostoc litchii]
MSLIAVTAIAVKDNLPYFLVEENEGHYQFFTTKMHKHNNDTSLGAALRGLKELGAVDFNDWRLGELTSVAFQGDLLSIYSFEVKDTDKIERELNYNLKFMPANQIHELLETLQTTLFVSFEEN